MICEYLHDIISAMSTLCVNSGSVGLGASQSALTSSNSNLSEGSGPSKKRKLDSSSGGQDEAPAAKRRKSSALGESTDTLNSDPTLASMEIQVR